MWPSQCGGRQDVTDAGRVCMTYSLTTWKHLDSYQISYHLLLNVSHLLLCATIPLLPFVISWRKVYIFSQLLIILDFTLPVCINVCFQYIFKYTLNCTQLYTLSRLCSVLPSVLTGCCTLYFCLYLTVYFQSTWLDAVKYNPKRHPDMFHCLGYEWEVGMIVGNSFTCTEGTGVMERQRHWETQGESAEMWCSGGSILGGD